MLTVRHSYARLISGALLAMALFAADAGCNQSAKGPSEAPPASADRSAGPSVALIKPERTTLRRRVRQPGYVQAFEQTPLFAKIPGYVQKVNVDIGDRVAKGDLLAQLWVPEMEVDVAQKKALVGHAEAETKQAKEAVVVAEADFKSAEAKVQATDATRLRAEAQRRRAQSQYERLAKAGRGGVIGQEDVEETRLGLEAAQAGLEEVQAQVRAVQADRDASRAKWIKAQADVAVTEARLEVAKKNYDQAKTMLEYRRVTAPFDGVVTQRNVDTGHFVQPGTGPKGEALFVVMRTDIMRIRIEVPEAEADWVAKGTPARIRIPVLPSYDFAGKVTRISWSLDRTARTLLTEIDVPDADGKLRPGMYADVTLTAERSNVWTLPASAILTQGDVTQGYQSYCFLIEGGRARRTRIEVGASGDERVEVLKKQAKPAQPGAEAGWEDFTGQESVVQGNLSALTDGQALNNSAL